MPTEVFLLDIDIDRLRETLLEVLDWEDEHGVLLAIIVMFEAFVVLASLRDGRTRADTECLRKIDRPATNAIKRLRDTIAHALYERKQIADMLRTVADRHLIERLYVKFFSKDAVVNECRYFEKVIRGWSSCSAIVSYSALIVDLIPESLRSSYPADDTQAALKFAYEQLTR